METYIEPIKFALFTFPFISFLFTLPYIFHQYHKYGSVIFRKAFIVYSFILYLTCIYFLVILPLPSKEYVASLTTPWVQLTPFSFVKDFFLESSFIWDDVSTYFTAMKEPYFYQVFYNILLTVPFGMYLRYYFNCSFKKTLCYSFLLTLFFEGTQLSGLYGIYPRPYRLFDIDDLFLNTLGGVIGYGITPLFSKFLTPRYRLDALSYQKGKKISVLRRFMAVGIDFVMVVICDIGMSMIGLDSVYLRYIFSIILIFMLVPIVMKGFTIGKKLMNIQIVDDSEDVPKWYQYCIRYSILYLFFIPFPLYILLLIEWFPSLFLLFVPFGVFYFVCVLHTLKCLLTKELFWYEKLSATKNKSTIVTEEEEC